jgi:hypothetical protein
MKQLYVHGGKAYLILKKKPIEAFQDKNEKTINIDNVKLYRDWVKADHVLRDQTHYMFCETIPDVEFEEIIE